MANMDTVRIMEFQKEYILELTIQTCQLQFLFQTLQKFSTLPKKLWKVLMLKSTLTAMGAAYVLTCALKTPEYAQLSAKMTLEFQNWNV